MTGRSAATDRCVIDGKRGSVAVVKARTRNGERLQISSGGERSIHFDALALEGLSWQDARDFADLPPATEAPLDAGSAEGSAYPPDRAEVEFETSVVNEFASVKVRKVRGAEGEFLEVEAPRSGYRIRLTAEALDSLAGQSMDIVSAWLETPLGPEH